MTAAGNSLRDRALALLDDANVEYRVVRHPAIDNVQEGFDRGVVELLGLEPGGIVRNLLVVDTHGNPVLIVTGDEGRVDLKAVKAAAGTTRLSFASPEIMMSALNTELGRVSLFDVLTTTHDNNDADSEEGRPVTVAVSAALQRYAGAIAFPLFSNAESIVFDAGHLVDVLQFLAEQCSIAVVTF
ncbi:YbaK/EbsC family protein [Bifidobacterium choloepi]|nr:YbaK/EbsC family protein [Bifidobacterium choloepi]